MLIETSGVGAFLFLLDGQRFSVDLPKLVLCLENLTLKSGFLILSFVHYWGGGYVKRVQREMGHAFMEGKRETRLGEAAGCQGGLQSFDIYSKSPHSHHFIDGLCRFLAVVQTLLV